MSAKNEPRRTERADTIMAIDLFADAEQHRTEHNVAAEMML
jgi:hypothetical protein